MAKTTELDMTRFTNIATHEIAQQGDVATIQVGVTIRLSDATMATVSFQDTYADNETRGAHRQRLAIRALEILRSDLAAL